MRGTVMNETPGTPEYERRLAELRAAHRALDNQINQLSREGSVDQLELQRLKKQKLTLKDRIVRMERDRHPDIIA